MIGKKGIYRKQSTTLNVLQSSLPIHYSLLLAVQLIYVLLVNWRGWCIYMLVRIEIDVYDL